MLPLYNIGYSDNAPMVTLGGAIVDELSAREIRTILEEKGMREFLDQERHLKIGVPPLTFKEKASLDQLLPNSNPLTQQDIIELGFRLKPSQIDAYHRFYRYYPLFGEMII